MKRILILKLGAIGDVIHSLPVLSTLRRALPKAHLAWAVEDTAYPVLEGNRDLDELILLERKRLKGWFAISYIRSWLGELRGKSFDTVLDLHNLLKTGFIAYASRASMRVGFRKFREGNFLFMNHWIPPEARHQHAVDKYLSLLAPLGIDENIWDRRFPLNWTNEDELFIDQFFREQQQHREQRWVVINPGASWPSKRWPPSRYAKVGDALIKEYSVRVLILWGPREYPLAESIGKSMAEKSVLAPKTSIKQLMALIKRCRLFISGDTGPVHIAAALGVPTVTLFGPSSPLRNGPYGEGHRIIKSPIGPAGPFQRKERGGQWLNAIQAETVIHEAIEQLK